MIRLFLVLLLALQLHADDEIDRRIDATSKKLSHFDSNYASINAKMAKTAKEILRKERAVLQQQKKIASLQKELKEKASVLDKARSDLQQLTGNQESLENAQRQLETELSDLLARTVSLSLVQDSNDTLSPDAVIGEEIFKALNRQTHSQIKKLGSRYRVNRKRLKRLTGKTAQLRHEITTIEEKKRSLQKAKKANERSLAGLRTKKEGYKKELKTLLAQKNALKKTLKQLQIIQESKEERAAAAEQERRTEALLASKPLPKVKSVGSSYHKARTQRYHGNKTIAPLDRYTVLKRYGTYTDPIYKIKIFNESVSLKPSKSDAKVKAVLNGKVILAQKTPLLENVVIIEHANGLHTIYAHLARIAPTVKKGKRLVRGSVIGRVNDELMFQVTQKNYHIDPLQLIR